MGDDKIYTTTATTHETTSIQPGFTAVQTALDASIRRKLNIAPVVNLDPLNYFRRELPVLDDRNDPPSLIDEGKSERKLGDSYAPIGRDYAPVRAKVVPNTYAKATDEELAVHISQGKQGISLSLKTLLAIAAWAEGK